MSQLNIAEAKAQLFEARRRIGDEQNECHISLVSAWEMAIKAAAGKLKLSVSVWRYFTTSM